MMYRSWHQLPFVSNFYCNLSVYFEAGKSTRRLVKFYNKISAETCRLSPLSLFCRVARELGPGIRRERWSTTVVGFYPDVHPDRLTGVLERFIRQAQNVIGPELDPRSVQILRLYRCRVAELLFKHFVPQALWAGLYAEKHYSAAASKRRCAYPSSAHDIGPDQANEFKALSHACICQELVQPFPVYTEHAVAKIDGFRSIPGFISRSSPMTFSTLLTGRTAPCPCTDASCFFKNRMCTYKRSRGSYHDFLMPASAHAAGSRTVPCRKKGRNRYRPSVPLSRSCVFSARFHIQVGDTGYIPARSSASSKFEDRISSLPMQNDIAPSSSMNSGRK